MPAIALATRARLPRALFLPPFSSSIASSSSSLIRQLSQQRAQSSRFSQCHASPSTTHSADATETTTIYDLFPTTLPRGPPPRGPFAVDVPALRREFLRLQATTHPDTQPESLRADAASASAHLNMAFRTLADPLQRAQYLLHLRGATSPATEEASRELDSALLADVLAAREDIDAALDESQLARPRDANAGRILATEVALEDAFARNDLVRAAQETVRLRYWVTIRDALDAWKPPQSQ